MYISQQGSYLQGSGVTNKRERFFFFPHRVAHHVGAVGPSLSRKEVDIEEFFRTSSRNVVVECGVVLVSADKVAINQMLDTLLEIRSLEWELEDVDDFSDEFVVMERFASLHDANQGSIDLTNAILEN